VARSSTSYVKGRSGNPLGRPKADFDLRDYAREFGRPAIQSLAELAGLTGSSPAINEAVRVAALRELLDRGYGKATQPLTGDGDGSPVHYTFEWAPATPAEPPSAAPVIDAAPLPPETAPLTLVWASDDQ